MTFGPTRTGRHLAAAVALAATVAACSGSGGGESGAPTTAAASPRDPKGTVLVGSGATSNISIDASTDGRTVAVAWYTSDDATGAEQVRVATSVDGGATFAEPVVVDEPAVEYPSVEVNDDGTVLLSAVHYDLDARIDPDDDRSWPSWPVLFRSTDRGRSFKQLAKLRDLVGERMVAGGEPPNMAASDDGRTVVVAWQDHTPPHLVPKGQPASVDGTLIRPVYASVSRDGGETFDAPVVAVPSTCNCCRIQTFFTPAGAGVAARMIESVDGTHDERDVAIALLRAGGTFADPVEVHDDKYVLPLDGCPASGPGVDGDDRTLHAAWWTGTEGRTGWWYASSTDGTTFTAPQRLPSDPDPGLTLSVALAVDGTGEAWIIGQHHFVSGADSVELYVWRAGNGTPARVADNPRQITHATSGYDVAGMPKGALVAWSHDGDVKIARYG